MAPRLLPIGELGDPRMWKTVFVRAGKADTRTPLLLIAVAAAAVFLSAGAAGPAVGAPADDVPSSIVEDYSYPDASKILAERGITLIKGDGHILLADCVPGGAGQIVARSTAFEAAICFRVTASVGRLTMSIPEVYSIKGDSHAGTATVTTDQGTNTTTLKKEFWNPINGGDGGVLIQLETGA
ncbi:hypothetical protein ACIBCH_35000 [Amycolatopsis thailandensis]|uniref:hypothetical protein n=1 Tax=Amycolatopsis thailandensis TaxID=589330 RepID=UPI00378A7E89